MRLSAVLFVLAATLGGLAVELPQPAVFAREPVEVITRGEVPRMFQGGKEYPLLWVAEPLSGGLTRFVGRFPADAPLGPWYVETEETCYSFIRVPNHLAILVIRGIPGMEWQVGDKVRVGDDDGICWFILEPGIYPLTTEFPTGRLVHWELTVVAGERLTVPLVSVEPLPTASAALPGNPFLVVMRILSPVDIPGFSLTAELPPGWDMWIRGPCRERLPCPFPVYAGRPAELELVLGVPAASTGTYEIPFHIPSLALRGSFTLKVRDCLDPREVVRHWDVAAGSIDLSRRGGVTYERLLWAIAHVGHRFPFACRSLTRTDLDDLVSEWVGTG